MLSVFCSGRRDLSVKYSSNPESLLLTILSNPHDLLVRGKIVGPGNNPPLLSVAQTLCTDEFTVIFEFFSYLSFRLRIPSKQQAAALSDPIYPACSKNVNISTKIHAGGEARG